MVQTEDFSVILSDFDGLYTAKDSDSEAMPKGKSPSLLNVRIVGTHVRGATGYSLTGTRNSSSGEITAQYTYKRSDGDQRMVRVRDTGSAGTLEWYDAVNDEWYALLGSLTTGKKMGFAEYNTSSTNNMIFCNGTDNLSKWTGAITRLTAAVTLNDTEINVADTSDFPANGIIIFNGTEIRYGTKTATKFIRATKTAITIAFVDSNPDTITDSGNGFLTAGFQAGDVITISGATNAGNNNTFIIATVVAGTITLTAAAALTVEAAGASVTIRGALFHASVGASDGVAEAADDSTHSALTKGNILLSAKDRLWIAGQPDAPTSVDYSDEGDAFTFTGGTNRADSGSEDFFGIGGAITGLAEKEDEIVVLGEDGGDGFSFVYPTSVTKAPQFRELFRTSGLGCLSSKSVFKANNEIYFANRNGIVALSDLEGSEKVFSKSITRDILPTTKTYDFSDAASIFHEGESILLVSCKTSPDYPGNDNVIGIEFYKDKDGLDTYGITLLDWPVNDWAILENSDGVPELYFGSSLEMNSFKGFDTYQNDGSPRTIRYATKRFNLKDPFQSKESRLIGVRGMIKDGTDIEARVLFNAGFLGEVSKTIESTGAYVSSNVLNTIGAFALGVNPIGASLDEVSDLKEFTVFLDVGVDYNWRDVQVVFESETDGGTFLISHVGFIAEEVGFATQDNITI